MWQLHSKKLHVYSQLIKIILLLISSLDQMIRKYRYDFYIKSSQTAADIPHIAWCDQRITDNMTYQDFTNCDPSFPRQVHKWTKYKKLISVSICELPHPHPPSFSFDVVYELFPIICQHSLSYSFSNVSTFGKELF